MIKEIIVTGNTIDEAITQAKAQLNAPENTDVSVEVLELPQKKTFGLFGGSKAKVRAYYEAPDPVPAPVKAEPKATVKPEAKASTKAEPKTAARSEPKVAARPEPKAAQASTPQEANAEPKAAAEVVYKDVPLQEIEPLVKYLTAILNGLGLEKSTISPKASENELILNIECEEDYGILIGRRGETLDSVQYLIRLFANHMKFEYDRVSINVGNYREKRAGNLKALAVRNAQQVIRYGRKVTLDPMNPYERHIIHTAVQDIKGATSYSVGSDNERRVVIALEEGFTPTHSNNSRGGKGGGYNNNRGGYNKGGGNRGGYNNNRSNNYNSQKPERSPAKDVETVSLYGKIEPKK